jgi:hypothetical protein
MVIDMKASIRMTRRMVEECSPMLVAIDMKASSRMAREMVRAWKPGSQYDSMCNNK